MQPYLQLHTAPAVFFLLFLVLVLRASRRHPGSKGGGASGGGRVLGVGRSIGFFGSSACKAPTRVNGGHPSSIYSN